FFLGVIIRGGDCLFGGVKVGCLSKKLGVEVFQLMVQETSHLVHSVSRGCITLARDLSRMVFTLRLLKGAKDT
ncbi:hypothetical protein, partial [Klebsiella pneumoniae]|uniref:hypothetical protein n=1 Tax=Klebsiella pneumoniae TaxID=573 RepID=UPI001F4B4173